MRILSFFVRAILLSVLLCAPAMAATDMGGTGLFFTYYDVRPVSEGGLGTSDNYFVITNPDRDHWAQTHVRVRTGDRSVELLDFDVMLSPADVFSFTISDAGAGVTFSSLDVHTISNSKMIRPFLQDIDGNGTLDGIVFSTDPSDPNFTPNLTSLIEICQGVSQAEAAALTKKGYAEVFMEGRIRHCATALGAPWTGGDKLHCRGADLTCGTPDDVLITDSTLYELTNNVADAKATGLCDFPGVPDTDIFDSFVVVGATPTVASSYRDLLEGRIYYATVDTSSTNVVRLAHLNAEPYSIQMPNLPPTIDAMAGGIGGFRSGSLILHQNTFDAERFSGRCLSAGDSNIANASPDNTVENCFAYTAANTAISDLDSSLGQGGADDINYCFYTDSIGNTGVWNKFGAGATFGPTLIDTMGFIFGARLGILQMDNIMLQLLSQAMSMGTFNFGFGPSSFPRRYVDSHYIYSPAPAEFDLTSAFSFIFPLQHYIGEQPKLGGFAFFDMDENTVSPPTTGFISPGLPGPGAPVEEEASLQTLTSGTPFSEGWLKIGPVTASNETSTAECEPGVACPGASINIPVYGQPINLFAPPATPASYIPGFTGATFVVGSQSLSGSLHTYSFKTE